MHIIPIYKKHGHKLNILKHENDVYDKAELSLQNCVKSSNVYSELFKFSFHFSAVPIFVQVQQKWRRLYQGTCVLSGSAIEFSMIHLKYIPTQYSHLAGLLDVFKSKIVS